MYYSNPEVSYIGKANFRSWDVPFGIYTHDKLLSIYCIGKTGTGKTTLLESLILQDIYAGRGITLFDVHGDLVKNILAQIPEHRKQDVVFIDPTDPQCQWSYNPLRKVSPEYRSLVASGLLEVFQKMFDTNSWGSKMEHLLRVILLSLLSQESSNFTHITRILNDEHFRMKCIENIENEDIKRFWIKEFPDYRKGDFLTIYNKVGAFLAHPAIKRLLVPDSSKTPLILRTVLGNSKILILNFSKGLLGSDSAYILGSLFLSSLSSAGFSRASMTESERKYHFIYLDECHNYTNKTIISMLSELRKYRISLVLAHQYIKQISPEIRDAILGNVGTIISFRTGLSCAKHLAQEMYPIFEPSDFINLENYDIYLKLMINGKPSKAFSATTIPFKHLYLK